MAIDHQQPDDALLQAIESTARRILGEQLLSCQEAAAVLGISVGALRKRVQRGSLKALKAGRSLRFRRSDLTQPATGS